MKSAFQGLLLALMLLGLTMTDVAQTLSDRTEKPLPVAPGQTPNADPVYQQVRNAGISGETISVSKLVLKRDAATFTFNSGSFYPLAPVNGKTTGAVFLGNAHMSMTPPIRVEQISLSRLTKAASLEEDFDHAVFLFTDSTYSELKKGGSASSGPATGGAAGILSEIRGMLVHKLHTNLSARITADVLSPQPGGFFAGFVHGNKYGPHIIYLVDPHGATDETQPEEVALITLDESKEEYPVIWSSFHYSDEYAKGKNSGDEQNGFIHIEHQQLDTEIEKNGKLNGKAITRFVAQSDGVRVVPFDLFPTLRVQSVTAMSGESLPFIQEDKKDDPDFYVILPKPLARGDAFTLTIVYSGKDAVLSEGEGNYFPVARSDWYPAVRFGDYSTYDMTFRVPKGIKLIATGSLKREINEGSETISEWEAAKPQAVAGFSLGRFKEQQVTEKDSGIQIESFANENPPNFVKQLQQSIQQAEDGGLNGSHASGMALGTMDTTSLNKKALAEAEAATQLYTRYFGELPYKHLAITQQTATNYGQAWPGLVYLPITYFFDTTVRHQLGMDDARGYFKVVEPHEVAHQWFGHMVGFDSYRDQWMSEGFAEFAASLYVMTLYKTGDYLKFWKDEHDLLTEKNKEGFRAIDVGPVTLSYRLNNYKTGNITRRLIYPKGAFILHMVRMMMFDNKQGDAAFMNFMQDFTKTFANRVATTQDFKTTLEKHLTKQMDIDGNGKLDWFFNEYIYGTELPNYKVDSSFSQTDQGVKMKLKITQSNVDEHFKMLVPVYLELSDGRIVRLGSGTLIGNTSVEKELLLGKLPQMPKRAMVNYYYDVLSTGN